MTAKVNDISLIKGNKAKFNTTRFNAQSQLILTEIFSRQRHFALIAPVLQVKKQTQDGDIICPSSLWKWARCVQELPAPTLCWKSSSCI